MLKCHMDLKSVTLDIELKIFTDFLSHGCKMLTDKKMCRKSQCTVVLFDSQIAKAALFPTLSPQNNHS